MVTKFTVLLVEDDPDACNAFMKYAETVDDMQLIGVTNSSKKALQYVKDNLPDAVILDLELHRGSGNGLAFLKELQELSLPKLPYILVTTNNMSEITHEQVRAMGADFIMTKYQQDYSVNSVVDFLRIMQPSLNHTKNNSLYTNKQSLINTDSPSASRLLSRINRELDLVGISPKAVGRKYLIDAIQLVMANKNSHVCAQIAKMHSKSDASVERAMQNAINRAWRTSCIDDLCCYYTAKINSEKGVPTLTEFVYYYAHKMGGDYPQKNTCT